MLFFEILYKYIIYKKWILVNDIYGNIISVYCYIYGGFFVSFRVFKIKWRYNVIEIFNYVSNVFLYRKVFKLLYLLCFEKNEWCR